MSCKCPQRCFAVSPLRPHFSDGCASPGGGEGFPGPGAESGLEPRSPLSFACSLTPGLLGGAWEPCCGCPLGNGTLLEGQLDCPQLARVV